MLELFAVYLRGISSTCKKTVITYNPRVYVLQDIFVGLWPVPKVYLSLEMVPFVSDSIFLMTLNLTERIDVNHFLYI